MAEIKTNLKPVGQGNPYYDNAFQEIGKNYVKELFLPTMAVQSREMITAQTLAQYQISAMADYLFKNGSCITGGKISVSKNSFFLQGLEKDINGLIVDYSSFPGRIFIGNISGQSIQCVDVDVENRYVYFRYLGSDIVDGENFVSTTTPYRHFTMQAGSLETGFAAANEPGVVYADGYFINIENYSMTLHPWEGTVDEPIEWNIGYLLTKNIITTAEDVTLLDNAEGTYNYNARGADRYQIHCQLYAFQTGEPIPENYIAGLVISNGVVIKDQITNTEFKYEDILAKRTYDESGSYSVNPWLIYNLEESALKTTADQYTVSIQPGLGYIYGYEVQNISSILLANDRARTFRENSEKRIYYSNGYYTYGAYDPATNALSCNGLPNYSTYETVQLCSNVNGTGNVLGECNIIEYSRVNNRFLIYLDNVSGLVSVFPSVKSIRSKATPSVYINLLLNTDNLAQIYGNTIPKIIESGYNVVRTVESNSINYQITKTYNGLSEIAGNMLVINELDLNIDFLTGSQNVVAIINTVTGKPIQTGDITAIPNNSGVSSYLTITSPNLENGTNYNVIVKVAVTNLSSRIKLLRQTPYNYTAPANVANIPNTITLPMEDGYKLVSVIQQNNIAAGKNPDITNLLKFDNGQTDTFYEKCTISGWTDSAVLSNRATANVATSYLISYQYYDHVGYGPFTVNSYVGLDNTNIFNGIDLDVYTQIYTYKGSNGNIYTLRDCLDFRIKRSEIGKTNVIFLDTDSEVRFSSTNYLPRIDLVWVSREKTWGITRGIASQMPEIPESKDGTMNIAWLYNEAYTDDTSKVKIVYFKNQRYTMEDIGKVAQNVATLTEAVALAQLERNALDQPILDQDGFNMYKTGIFTDNFANFANSNYQDELYTATIDVIEKSLRAPFNLNHFNFKLKSGSNYLQRDITATMNYTTSVYASNPYGTSTINIQELMFFVWEGSCKLTPSIDTWIDDKGNVIVGADWIDTPEPQKYRSWSETYMNHGDKALSEKLRAMGYLDAWGNVVGTTTSSSAQWGQNIADWGFGHAHGATFKVEETTDYEGSWEVQSITSVVPQEYQNQFMRQNTVTYNISGMRPGITFNAYFDTNPLTISNNIPDASGNVTGTFVVPPNTPVGTKIVEFYDVKKTQYATAQYTGNSKTVWKDITVVYIRTWDILRITRKAQAVADYDPIAQTFYVDNPDGIFIDSIDVFFATKDDVADVECYIVETDNGYPTDNILPFAYKSLSPQEVSVVPNTKTTFRFDSPIYLYGETEYAFVLATSTYNYSVYQSVLGQKDVMTNKTVQEQPFLGSVFKSQNGRTWTAYQEADLKFNVNRCVFNITDTSNVVFNISTTGNTNLPYDVATMTSIINSFVPSGTNVTFDYMFSSEFAWTPFNNQSDTFMTTLKQIVDDTSLQIRMNLYSNSQYISPQIDLEQVSAIFTNNVLSDSTVYEGYPYYAGTYISNTVNLTNESQNLLAIFDAIKPEDAKVDVFFKTNITSTPYLTQATMGTGSSTDDLEFQTGKTFQTYYYNSATSQLEPKNKLIITGFSGGKIYVRSVGNTDEFFVLTDPANENIYNGLDTKYTGIFLLDVISDVNINCPQWSSVTSPLITLNNYVINGGYIWRNVVQPVLTTYTPSDLSIVWKKVPAYKVISGVLTEPNIEWRKAREIIEVNTKLTSVDKENYFVEYRYEPEIQIESPFQNFATRIDMYCKDKINIPRIKSLRVLSTNMNARQ